MLFGLLTGGNTDTPSWQGSLYNRQLREHCQRDLPALRHYVEKCHECIYTSFLSNQISPAETQLPYDKARTEKASGVPRS